ncbi:MAG: NAD-dependent deacylase [Thermodesulfobacteriota bacterium]
MLDEGLDALCEMLLASKAAMALTGAGISAESGIPTFRGVQGLWEKYDIMEYAHIEAFLSNPAKVWGMLLELDETIKVSRPNPAHLALAQLEDMGLLHLVVTQNVDNLHQDAGSRQVVEFHGNARRFKCLDCGAPYERGQLDLKKVPPRCYCGGLIKPDVIFFGEAIPWAANLRAFEMARKTDLILVVGTSAVVAPASEIPVTAKSAGAKVVEINPEETVLTGYITDLMLQGPASRVLPPVVERVRARRSC